jgi:hypothetical protein
MRLHNTVTYSHLFQEIHVAQEAVGQHPPGQDRAGLRPQPECGPGRHYHAGKWVISCLLPRRRLSTINDWSEQRIMFCS